MKKILSALTIIFTLSLTINVHAQNLVQNGSAEYIDTTTGWPEGWTSITGNWQSAPDIGHVAVAHDSSHIFYEGSDESGILQQDVNVSGYATQIDNDSLQFEFLGWTQSRDEGSPSDQASVSVQCLDNTKTTVLQQWHSDTLYSLNQWQAILSYIHAAPGTRWVRIRLIAIRNQGTSNDAYFDDIHLIPMAATGVNNVINNNFFAVYPNPATDELKIVTLPYDLQYYNFFIISANGVVVKKGLVFGSGSINVSNLPIGMYAIHVYSDDHRYLQIVKFIKE